MPCLSTCCNPRAGLHSCMASVALHHTPAMHCTPAHPVPHCTLAHSGLLAIPVCALHALLLVLCCLCHKYLQKAMRWRPCSELKQSYARKPQPHVGNLKTSACGSVERMA